MEQVEIFNRKFDLETQRKEFFSFGWEQLRHNKNYAKGEQLAFAYGRWYEYIVKIMKSDRYTDYNFDVKNGIYTLKWQNENYLLNPLFTYLHIDLLTCRITFISNVREHIKAVTKELYRAIGDLSYLFIRERGAAENRYTVINLNQNYYDRITFLQPDIIDAVMHCFQSVVCPTCGSIVDQSERESTVFNENEFCVNCIKEYEKGGRFYEQI